MNNKFSKKKSGENSTLEYFAEKLKLGFKITKYAFSVLLGIFFLIVILSLL